MDFNVVYEWALYSIFALIIIIAKWIMFKKAWEKWWWAIIPVYNEYLLFKIAWHKKWIWWILVPPIYLFVKIATLFDISKKFWKSNWCALWLYIAPVIFYPIIAWWKSKYSKDKKMKWTIFWKISATIIWLIALLWSSFVWVLFHPGQNEKLDKIRLNVQTPMMKLLSDYLIDWRANNYLWLIDEHQFLENDPDMISWEEFEPCISQLQRWDIIFTDWAKYISSIVIPWTWKHALIYLWDGKIIDATSKWVTQWELKDLDNLSRGSLLKSIIAFRPNLTEEQKEIFISFAFEQEGKPYDFDYNKEDKDAYYCSELVADWLKEAWIDVTYQSKSIWKMVVSPEDMVNYILNEWLWKNEFEDIFHLVKLENNDWTYTLVDGFHTNNSCL